MNGFIRAKNSRTKLRITAAMVRVLFTYHQVMPVFLEFLFNFRKHEYKKNFDFSGFKANELAMTRPLRVPGGSSIISTAQLQLCYNLKCMESTPRPPEWPWSKRQVVVFHGFNISSGDAVWITIKGNTDVSPRIEQLVQESAPSDPATMLDAAGAFDATLATHLAYCEMATENWAAYVAFLEDQLQDKTRYALLAEIPTSPAKGDKIDSVSRIQTEPQPFARRSTMSSIARVSKEGFSKIRRVGHVMRSAVRPAPINEDNELESRVNPSNDEDEVEDFTYDDLRELQHIEDQGNMTVLALRSNISIISELAGYYDNLHHSEDFQNALASRCTPALKRFAARGRSILNDLKLHQSRVETLLQLLADRKALVSPLMC